MQPKSLSRERSSSIGRPRWLRPLAILLCVSTGTVACGGARARRTTQVAELPLAAHIRAGDRVLTIERLGDPPLGVPFPRATVSQALAAAAEEADAVVVFEATRIESQLIDRGEWVSTRISGYVRDELAPSLACGVACGKELVLSQDGGEVAINGVTVRVGIGTRKAFERARRYLVSLKCRKTLIEPYVYWRVDSSGRLHDTSGLAWRDTWSRALDGTALRPTLAGICRKLTERGATIRCESR